MLQWLVIWAGPCYSLAAECCLSEIEMQRRTHCDIRNWESSHVCVCAKRQHFGFFLPNILRLHIWYICEFCVYYMCILYAIWEHLGWQQGRSTPVARFQPSEWNTRPPKELVCQTWDEKLLTYLKHGSGLLCERHLWQLLGGTVLDFNKNCGCTWHRLFATNDITWFIDIIKRYYVFKNRSCNQPQLALTASCYGMLTANRSKRTLTPVAGLGRWKRDYIQYSI